MVKIGKTAMVAKLRFPEFGMEDDLFHTTIGDLMPKIVAGGTPNTSEPSFWNGELRWMNSGDLNLKKVYEVQGRITELGLRSSSTRVIPERSVLIGLAGQGKTRGTVAMNMVPLCTNQSVAAIFPNPAKVDSDFLYHNLDNRYDELRRLSAGGEGRGGLNLHLIRTLRISLPSLSEQRKIADCLTSLDELIAAQACKVVRLKAYKRGLMQQLFPCKGETFPRLRFPEFRDGPPWMLKRIGDLLTEVSRSIDMDDAVEYSLVTVKRRYGGVVSREHLKGREIKVKTQFVVRKGDFIISKRQIVHNACGIVPSELDGAIVSNEYSVLGPKDECDIEFFNYFAQQPAVNVSFLNSSVGIVIEKMLFKLNTWLKHEFLFPTVEEQRKIAAFLASIELNIIAESEKLESLKSHKKGLMQQLLPSMEEK